MAAFRPTILAHLEIRSFVPEILQFVIFVGLNLFSEITQKYNTYVNDVIKQAKNG